MNCIGSVDPQAKDVVFILINIYIWLPDQLYYLLQKIPAVLKGIRILTFTHYETIVFFHLLVGCESKNNKK